MNKPGAVKIAGRFEAEALRVLENVPGLSIDRNPPGGRADAVLRFAGRSARFDVEFKQRANAATAWQLVHTNPRSKAPLLLIAGETTQAARDILQAHGIAVIDGLGNAHIDLPGLFFHVTGRRRDHLHSGGPAVPPSKLSGQAGVVAQALLTHPKRTWKIQDLVAESHASAGLVHRVLTRLEREGVATVEGSGPSRVRTITNPTALLDLWVEENTVNARRTSGYVLAQTPRQLIQEVGMRLGASGVTYALTGAGGASLVAPFVTAIPVVETWVDASITVDELYEATRADRVTSGANVVFLQSSGDLAMVFREKSDDLWVANRFRLYADLLGDPRRGREQAEHLRKELIGF